jgi:hypothetical protein
MKNVIFLLMGVTIALHAFGQKTVEGVTFQEKFTYKNQNLVLNGVGLREKWFLDLYVAGLYVANKSKDAEKIIMADEPTAFRMKMVSNMITSEKMAEATKEGFHNSMNGNTKPLQKEIDQFLAAFKGIQIKSGDMCELVYVPGEGVHFIANGKEITLIKGLEFKQALFRIWLGKVPADENLKTGLLTF